jgi:hypothetical protein
MSPRETCLVSPVLIWGLAAFNLITFVAYVWLALIIKSIHRAVGPRMPEGGFLHAAKSFLFCCSLSHLSGALVIFFLLFGFELVAVILTAVASLVAASILHAHRATITASIVAYLDLRDRLARSPLPVANP